MFHACSIGRSSAKRDMQQDFIREVKRAQRVLEAEVGFRAEDTVWAVWAALTPRHAVCVRLCQEAASTA
jgi:hypothetical protein